MKVGTASLFHQALAKSRVLCPTQASRLDQLSNEISKKRQMRALFYATDHRPRRLRLVESPKTSQRAFHASSRLQATKNPYKVLGVDKGASTSDIKKAYYSLAKKYHPDTSKEPDAKEKFAEAQSAYELLNDPQKKAAWDQFGAAAFDQGGDPGGRGGDPFAGGGPFGGGTGAGGFPGGFGGGFGAEFNFEDLFRSFGGGRRSRGTRNPFQQEEVLVGDRIETSCHISFMDAAKGTSKSINITPLTTCKTCSGSGLKPGMKRSECKSCGGSGSRVHFATGGFQMASTCNACDGQGVTIPTGGECRTCAGNGVTRERKTINVDIPAGIEDGMRLRLDGEGDAPVTGAAADPDVRTLRGDLYVLVRVAADPKFKRAGSDVLYTATIPLTTAVLGGEVKIPTLDGDVSVKVATGTATGDTITLGGKGMKKLEGRRGGIGDLKVEFKVAMPKYLSANQRTIVEMLADELGDKTAKRIMNVGRNKSSSAADSQSEGSPKSEGFLRSVWQKLKEHSDSGLGDNGSSHQSDSAGTGPKSDDETIPNKGSSTGS